MKDLQKINDVLGGRLPRSCPACQENPVWTYGGVSAVKKFGEGLVVPMSAATPLVKISCSNCGYTMLFNAVKMGLVSSDPYPRVNQAPSLFQRFIAAVKAFSVKRK